MTPKDIANAVFPALKSKAPSASLRDGWVNLTSDKYYNVHFDLREKGVTIHLGEAKSRHIPMNKKGEFNYGLIADRIIAMQNESIAINKEYNRRALARKKEESAAKELNERFKDVAYISPSIHNDGTYTIHLKDLDRTNTKKRVVKFLEKYRARMKV